MDRGRDIRKLPGMAPLRFVQAQGRPDLSGRLHILEVPIHIIVTVLLTRAYGIMGAAYAVTLRTLIDGAVLLAFTKRLAPEIALNIGVVGQLSC